MFARYGLPGGLRLDDGLPWGGSPGNDLPSAFGLGLAGLGLRLTYNPPRQPRYNGVVEKSHDTNRRWSEPGKAPSPEEWQRRIDAMDRRQREAYPHLGGRSRLAAYPGLGHSGRAYGEGWEEDNWGLQSAKEYLAGHVARRRVSTAGRVTLWHRPYHAGRAHAGATVLACYDPQANEWFMTEEGGGQVRRRPAPEIGRERILALDIAAK